MADPNDAMIPSSAAPLPTRAARTHLDMADLVRRAAFYQHRRDANALVDSMAQEITLAALLDVLIARGVVDEAELNDRIELVAPEIEKKRNSAWSGPQIFQPLHPDKPDIHIDCESRYGDCGGACCVHFNVQLTLDEIHSGNFQWDVGDPYRLERGPDGHCINLDLDTLRCRVWKDRPTVCRQYSCQTDSRVWTDFDLRVPSERTLVMVRHDRFRKGAGPQE